MLYDIATGKVIGEGEFRNGVLVTPVEETTQPDPAAIAESVAESVAEEIAKTISGSISKAAEEQTSTESEGG